MRGRSLRQVRAALGNAAGLDLDTSRMAQLIRQINANSADLVDFFELWRDLKRSRLPRVAPDGRLDLTQFRRLEALPAQVIDSLGGWARASGVIREVGGAAFSPYTLAFLMVLTRLTGRAESVVPIISWRVKDRLRRVAVV